MAGLIRLGIASTVGMYFVLLSGSLVTNTGSADGCGQAWPFCDGDWTTLATFIEVNHRLITGVLGIMILVLSVGAWRAFGNRRDIRWLVIASLFFLVLQSFLGAAAVMWGSSPAVMASHFGVSLASFGSVFLLTIRVRALADRASGVQRHDDDLVEPSPQIERFRRLVYVAIVLTLAVVYGGALLRHTNSGLACIDWPLCNGQVFPGFSGPVGLVFMHRLSVVALTVFVAYMGHQTRAFRISRPDLYRGSLWAVITLVIQSLTGWLIVTTRAAVAANMMHAAVLIIYFGILLYLAIQTTPLGVRYPAAPMPEPAAEV